FQLVRLEWLPAKWRAQWIPDHHRLPAQGGKSQVEGFGKIEAGKIRRKQDFRADGTEHVGLGYLSRNPRNSGTDEIANERIGGSFEPRRSGSWRRRAPVAGRLTGPPADAPGKVGG